MLKWSAAFGIASAAVVSLAAAQGSARGDPRLGKQAFAQCATCHNASGSLGPNLAGVIGRRAGARSDYRYSTAMRASGIVWDEAKLSAFLRRPQQVVRGNKMPYGGLSDEKRIVDIVAYLKAQ